jgi:hypothetical protein
MKDSFGKVSYEDLLEAYENKLREAAELTAEAEAMSKALNEALRRAKGNRQALLYDVRDELDDRGGDKAAT